MVDTYKSLSTVEQAFRTMKTTHLHVRPVFHKTDDRIRSHMFLCMLSYYLQWHMRQKLKPLFETDGTHEDRRWTIQSVIACMASLTRNKVKVGDTIFFRNSEATDEQQKIFDLLGVAV